MVRYFGIELFMDQIKIYSLFTDGGARGNPGPAAAAYVLLDEHRQLLSETGLYIGKTTNNTAEYIGIQKGLEACLSLGLAKIKVACFLDSELVVCQIKGLYKIKQAHLQELARVVFGLIKKLHESEVQVVFNHVPRNQNKRADQLVNQALDIQTSLSR
jgi:ribonuclease HI